MEKGPESTRPTTNVFQQSTELVLLGRGKRDWCNSKNLPTLQTGLEKLKTADISMDYDPKSYLILNLLALLKKTSLSTAEQKLAYFEIRGAWDEEINRAHAENATDNYGFKERGVHNLFWLEGNFKLSKLCKKMSIADGSIHFLDKDGKDILSLPLDLKSRTREILESREKCKEDRGKQEDIIAKSAAEKPKKIIKDFEYFKDSDSWMIGDGKSEISATGKDFYTKTHQQKIEIHRETDLIGIASWNTKQDCYVWEKPTDTRQKGEKVYFKHGQIYAIFKVKEDQKKKPVILVNKNQKHGPRKTAQVQAPTPTRVPTTTTQAPTAAVASAQTATPTPAEPFTEPAPPIGNPKLAEAEQENNLELPEDILPLLNNKGHLSIAILAGRKAGEGDGAGLFDTIKQLVYDPARNTLLTINYSRDMSYRGTKLNTSTKNNPAKSRRVLEELSGEQVPYHLTLGLEEAVKIFDILIAKITGPIQLNLPANYVIAIDGEYKLFPKNTEVKDGKTMLAILQFRYGWIVPDGYQQSASKAPKTSEKGVIAVGADDSGKENASRIARQDTVISAVISALKSSIKGKSKFSILAKYALPARSIYEIVKASTNMPVSPFDMDTVQALLEMGQRFNNGGKKTSISLHYTAGEKTQKGFPAKVAAILPPNKYATRKVAKTEAETGIDKPKG